MKHEKAYEALVNICANLKSDEKALVISDEGTQRFGRELAEVASRVGSQVAHRTIRPLKMHGQEPPADVAREMLEQDVIFGITWYSLAHSQARYAACRAGARYLSLPCYNDEVLSSPAMLADFRKITETSQKLADRLTQGKEVRLETPLGTSLRCRIEGRTANAAPGWTRGPGDLSSPPDAEANIAPLETESEGVIVVDGSIPCDELGLLDAPVKLTVRGGSVVHIEGPKAEILTELFDRLGNPKTRVIAEFGIGLNPLAELKGFMLEDEGCLGTVHIGIGANATIGGQNKVPFHLDHIIRNASVFIDDVPVLKDGKLL